MLKTSFGAFCSTTFTAERFNKLHDSRRKVYTLGCSKRMPATGSHRFRLVTANFRFTKNTNEFFANYQKPILSVRKITIDPYDHRIFKASFKYRIIVVAPTSLASECIIPGFHPHLTIAPGTKERVHNRREFRSL